MANNNGNGKSLESWIWDAACSIRGAKDAPKYKDYILPLIFTKRLCDVFDDELNRIAAEVGSRRKAFQLASMDWQRATPGKDGKKKAREVDANEARKKEQAAKGIDGLTFFVYRMLEDAGIGNAEAVSCGIRQAFFETPN